MTLNAKCTRDIMLYLNDNLKYNGGLFISNSNLNYSKAELVYTCDKLKEANLITGIHNVIGDFEIDDITTNGHYFISKIKDNTIWKEVLNKVSNLAEPLTIALLENLITEITTVS